MYLDESQWRENFQPQASPYGDGSDLILERSDPRSEAHVANVPHELVWTEYVDYSFDDDDHSIIQNGYVPSDIRSEDLLGWYICRTPWTTSAANAGEIFVTVEW